MIRTQTLAMKSEALYGSQIFESLGLVRQKTNSNNPIKRFEVSQLKNIYFICHRSATVQDNDAHPTIEGRKQSQQLATFLDNKGIESIKSSPLLRTRESIEPFAGMHNRGISLDDRLRERILSTINLDNWVECLEKTFADKDLRFGNGDTILEAMQHSLELVNGILAGNNNTVALVTHGNMLALMLSHFGTSFGFET